MGKVLIVDDDVVNSSLYSTKLKSEGHEVDFFSDGISAEKKIDVKYDLILLDVMIPGVDGFTLLQEFRKGINKNSIILVYTNLVSSETKKQAEEFGASDLLYKIDTTPQQLVKKIQEYLEESSVKEKNIPEIPVDKPEEDILKQAAE